MQRLSVLLLSFISENDYFCQPHVAKILPGFALAPILERKYPQLKQNRMLK